MGLIQTRYEDRSTKLHNDMIRISRLFRYAGMALALVPLSASAQLGTISSWSMLVSGDGAFRYSVSPDTAWKDTAFIDSHWPTGTGAIGYGNNDDETVIPAAASVFVRKTFTISDTSAIDQLYILAHFDDGFVAYINGFEVARYNMGDENTPVAVDGYASTELVSKRSQGKLPRGYLIDPDQLKYIICNGENVFAAEVHNVAGDSTGITAMFYLFTGSSGVQEPFTAPPSWFVKPPLFSASTNLPIVRISTDGGRVPDAGKISARMGITYAGKGIRNLFAAPALDYNGYIGIETRGQSSQEFPKKSYSVETRDNNGNNLDVPLLGMPAENDWVLHAPYTDKSLMRNYITYEMWRRMGHYSVRTHYCELVLNERYMGVYMLTEQIKKDDNRLDLSTLKPEDVFGSELTGGYIIKVDKQPVVGYNAWVSKHKPYKESRDIMFQYVYPQFGDIMPEQEKYIQDFVSELETELLSDSAGHWERLFLAYIDQQSAIDKLLITELSKDVDSYRYSQYMYKEKDSQGGLLHFGPLWDYDTGYGNYNAEGSQVQQTRYWMYDSSRTRMFWFDRMMTDTAFRCQVAHRWSVLRSSVLSDKSIFGLIDSTAALLNEAQERNHFKWSTLGRYVWPNNFVAETYAEEISYTKNWIRGRTAWMDSVLQDTCYADTALVTASAIIRPEAQVAAFPNPFSRHVSFILTCNSLLPHELSVYTIDNQLVMQQILSPAENGHCFADWDGTDRSGNPVAQGMYIYRIEDGHDIRLFGKVLKR